MSRLPLVIYGPDNEPARLATPQEKAQFDLDEKARIDQQLYRMACEIHEAKLDKKMYAGFRRKGIQQNKTRSSFAHRMRNKQSSAVKFESGSVRWDKNGNPIPPTMDIIKDWDYCPPGEGTLWRTVPRTMLVDSEVFDVWLVRRDASGHKRSRCVEKAFKRNCGSGECGKNSCAMCYAIANIDVKESETIQIKVREGPKPRVIDPSGVNPKGNRNSKAKDMGEDQRAMFQLTSTIHSHKPGASEQGRGTDLPRDPADAKKYHR